ncbi:unnamed protein product [Dovyalis caffra]|uniref:RING-type domain-containing protein n=1 Tax=Dovyalis caffra TaxID=77055 RepID=A0AAV1RJU6_9ROSI|nr:unnamed protein product [Dovyalis caffra]
MNLLEKFDNKMIFVESIDSDMVFLDNVDNTADLLENMGRLEENLWEAKTSYFRHFDLNFPTPVQYNLPPYRMCFPSQPHNFQAELYGPTRQHRTAQHVEVIDDDVAIISPNIFDQARKKARRNPDAARENINMANQARSVLQFPGLSQPVPSPQSPGFSETLPPPQLSETVSPPGAPAFRCPICMDELQEATSTKCGHVFCKDCIQKALAVQKKCPTCRMKCRAKSIYRIFLPAERHEMSGLLTADAANKERPEKHR